MSQPHENEASESASSDGMGGVAAGLALANNSDVPYVLAPLPAATIPADLIEPDRYGNPALNRKKYPILDKKVEGELSGNDWPAALKEAYGALLLAQDDDVKGVAIGNAAIAVQYPRNQRSENIGKNTDVIGFITETSVKQVEAKGISELYKGLFTQLPTAVKQLRIHGIRVEESTLVTDPIKEYMFALDPSSDCPTWCQSLAAQTNPKTYHGYENLKPPLSPNFVYLLPRDWTREFAPSGLAIPRSILTEPQASLTPIRIHSHVALPYYPSLRSDSRTPNWGSLRRLSIPGASRAPVTLAMVKANKPR